MGWGIFNLVEGTIDHHILGIHHVYEPLGLSIYDYVFLISGVLMVLIGLLLIRKGKRGFEHLFHSAQKSDPYKI